MNGELFLYNTTFVAETEETETLVRWLINSLLPTAIGKEGGEAYFLNQPPFSPQIMKVMGSGEESVSIAVHLYTDALENIENWYADYGAELFSEALERWNQRVMFFSTTLKSVYAES